MATRKILINRHTSGSSAPQADSMYLGEIAVAHETGKETLFTKNNAGNMVPFISCAQTISIVSGMIASVDVVYDVNKKEGEPYINVETGGTDHQKVFTLSTSGVASETNLNALSSATISNLQSMTNILTALTDVVVTAITGDDIITATEGPDPATTGSNVYTITHKQALATNGFNKLDTDSYGHVTAATPVATADIQALGFKTSAETGEDLEALSASVVANETHISELSAGTQHDIEALSGDVVEYVKVVSGNIETVINELSAGTLQLSADTHNTIAKLSADTEAAIEAAIEGLDSDSATTDNRHYVTAITIEDGKIVSFGEATDPQLSVESAGTGNVVSSIAVNDHKITYQTVSVATSEDVQKLSAATIALSAGTVHDLEELSGATEAISGYAHDEIAQLSGATEAISGFAHDEIAALSAGTIQLSGDVVAYVNQLSGYAHGEIVELSGAVQANETDIDNLSAATLALSAVTLTGVSLNNTPLAVSNHIVSVPVAVEGSDIGDATESGAVADALAVKEYVESIVSSAVNYKGATDDVPAGTPTTGDLYIASSAFTVGGKNVEVGDFIIYNGDSWDVIEKNLDGAITGNLTQDTVVLGDSTNSVKSLANGASGQVLTMAGGAPAWVDDPELTVVSAGTGNVLTDITVDDHEITFTKGITAASDANLQALSGAVEDFSGATDAKFIELSAYTKDVDDKVKALSAGTIQLSADTKAAIAALSAGTIQLSADTKSAIEQLSGFAHNSMIARDDAVFSSAKTYTDEKVAAEIALLDSSTAVTAGKYITGIAIADGKISGITEESLPANVVLTATTATPVDTASAVLTGVTASGADNHELTFGMSNKVFSASTSESADVATNAAHASAATKVDEKLTISDAAGTSVEYDGSAAQSVTFGTATSVSGQNSMSMNNGVVDVDVIDCGTY